MKIKVGNIDSLIETDNPQLIPLLSKKWSFFVPGYAYVPAYKKGHWDGRQKFVTSGGKFKSGLLEEILQDLKDIGCIPEIESESNTSKTFFKRKLGDFTLYDYQEAAVVEMLKSRRGLVVSPTGSGKTLIMASAVTAFPKSKIVILFDEIGILQQTYNAFVYDFGLKDIGICYGGNYIDDRVMLCTVQSIEKILYTHLDESEVLMVDEVHKFSSGEIAVAAIGSFKNAPYRFGFTATIPDDHIRYYTLLGAFGPKIHTKSTAELIEDGKLAKPDIQIITYEDGITENELDEDYKYIYQNYIVNSEKRNGVIFSLCAKIADGRSDAKVCILVQNLEHLEILKSKIPNCYSLEGANSIEERQQTIKDFIESGKPAFLIGTKVLQTGIDIKEITHFINARGLKDKIPTLQGLGRGLRKADGKSSVMVYDFWDDVPHLKKHSKERIKHYEKEGHKIQRIKL
jgi:superfamily II DNA or RNA helicase